MARRKIEGSRAIVTGASSGIGRALSVELARGGAKLVVTARREERLRGLVDEIVAAGGRAEMVPGDVTDESVRRRVVETAQSVYGGLDCLVNNAGVGATGPFERADPARLRHLMEVNLFAPVEMLRLCLPLLREGADPIVVNVGSIVGRRGTPYNSEYSASKFAIHGFSQAVRAEFTKLGIDVLVVSPGTTETEFFDSVLENAGEPNWPTHAPVSAETVARKIVRAMRRGRHEIIPYGWGKVLCWLDRLSPTLVDRIMARYV